VISRDFGNSGWASAGSGMPPPLHIYDTDSQAANWHPLPRIVFRPTPPGPVMVRIPVPAGAGLGDDPTDPTAQTRPRRQTNGMIGWLNEKGAMS
jgi:hypothetical protein